MTMHTFVTKGFVFRSALETATEFALLQSEHLWGLRAVSAFQDACEESQMGVLLYTQAMHRVFPGALKWLLHVGEKTVDLTIELRTRRSYGGIFVLRMPLAARPNTHWSGDFSAKLCANVRWQRWAKPKLVRLQRHQWWQRSDPQGHRVGAEAMLPELLI